jgi:tetratricopeptide (TPR) repeat protein
MRKRVTRHPSLTIALMLLFLTAPLEMAAQGGPPEEVRRAQAMLQAKDYDGAIKLLEDFTQRNPTRMGAMNLLGTAYKQKGELEKAVQAFEKVSQLRQLRPQALYEIASINAGRGDKEGALKYLQMVRETGNFDMDQILNNPDFEGLKGDARFRKLIPKPEEFSAPFVEPVKIIGEWTGESKGDQFGWIARRIGDVDGDKVSDFTTSAPTHALNGRPAGRVYVYSSKSGKLLWMQSGQPGDLLGIGIEGAGDVNADGVPDVIAGAPGAGRAYVYSGRDGKLLLTLGAGDPSEAYGRHVATVGDVNGDRHDDLIVGAPGTMFGGAPANAAAQPSKGRAYIYSGRDGSLLLTLEGERAGDAYGSAVSGYKDKKDSFLIVGAPAAGPNRSGRVYVYEALSNKPRFVFDSDETGAAFGGMFLSVIGDVNGDKRPDIYISDWPNNAKGNSTGRIYVYSGVDGKPLLTLTGEAAGDGFGVGVADAGDMDHDGHDDLILGAWQHSSAASSAGRVYLYSGKDGRLMRTMTCRIAGDTFGFDATSVGDVDGDGVTDFLLSSAWSGIKGFQTGRVFIISGKLAK